MGPRAPRPDDHRRRSGVPLWGDVLPRPSGGRAQLFGQSRCDRARAASGRSARAPDRAERIMSDRKPPRTTLQKLLSRFHFGVTLFAVALSGLAIMLAGVAALDRKSVV